MYVDFWWLNSIQWQCPERPEKLRANIRSSCYKLDFGKLWKSIKTFGFLTIHKFDSELYSKWIRGKSILLCRFKDTDLLSYRMLLKATFRELTDFWHGLWQEFTLSRVHRTVQVIYDIKCSSTGQVVFSHS